MTTPHPSPTQGHTPWVLRPIAAYTGERMILDAHGHYVATVQIYQTPRRCGLAHEAERNAKAEQIIRAVNSHQALVDALTEWLAAQDAHEAAFDPETNPPGCFMPHQVAADERLTRAVEQASAALALAKEGK